MAASTNSEDVSQEMKKSKSDNKSVRVIKTPVDLQRLKLEKLMNNPTKEVIIPEKSKEKAPRAPLEFIRNIWGSSAGAGSGDFHVYRGVRRREYARQKFIKEKAEKDELDEVYKQKLEQNRQEAEEKTAKNKAKRLKKKKWKAKKRMKKCQGGQLPVPQESSSEDSDEVNDEGGQPANTNVRESEDGSSTNTCNTESNFESKDGSSLD